MRTLRQTKGSALVETAAATFLFVSFVIFSTMASLTIFDASRDGRVAALAGDLTHQIFLESATPTNAQLAEVPAVLRASGYISSGEDYLMIVSEFENDASLGHLLVSRNLVGPNTFETSKVGAQGSSSGAPGIHLGANIYQIEVGQKMLVTEVWTGRRGRTDRQGGALPYYEFSVIVYQP